MPKQKDEAMIKRTVDAFKVSEWVKMRLLRWEKHKNERKWKTRNHPFKLPFSKVSQLEDYDAFREENKKFLTAMRGFRKQRINFS